MTTAETIAYIRKTYGRSVGLRTLFRWLEEGTPTPAGKVKLAGLKLGGRWCISPEAVSAFAAAVTDAGEPAGVQTPAQRQRDAQDASRRLAAAGW
jgi:hypothetical protein